MSALHVVADLRPMSLARALLIATAVVLTLLGAPPVHAGGRGGGGHGSHGGGHGFHGGHAHHGHGHRGHFGGAVVVGVGPWWWGPSFWYPPYGYGYWPPLDEQPVVYIQRPEPSSWYFCPSTGSYYPTTPSCPEPWIRVAPRDS